MHTLSPQKRIFVFSVTSGIGDMVMTIPMLKLLHERMPDAELTLAVLSEGARQLFETCPFVSKLIRVETGGHGLIGRNWRLLRDIRRNNEFDLCIATCITGYLYLGIDGILANCMRAQHRVGFAQPRPRWPLLPLQLIRYLLDEAMTIDFSKHYVAHNVDLLKLLGIDADEVPDPELWLTSEDVTAADQYLDEQGIRSDDLLIGVHPGGNCWIMKQWPKQKYAALIEKLEQDYPGVRILLLGGPDEESVKQEIAMRTVNARPIAVEAKPLRQTAALIERCHLFIGNDSSLMHVAAAVGTPVVGIFGPTNPLTTGPYGSRSRVATCSLDCQPCHNVGSFVTSIFRCKQRTPYACLTQLPVSEVLGAAKELL